VARTTPHDRTVWVALLRGVNVGRGNQLGMADLRQALEASGFEAVRTLGRSGNLVVRAGGTKQREVAGRVGDAVAAVLGKRVAVIVRSAADFRAVTRSNPIPDAADEGSRLHVMFLDGKLSASERAAVTAIEPTSDVIAVRDREIYVWYRAGMSASDTAGRITRALHTEATDRNWNTVLKLNEAAESLKDV
jgi:uncharacterized protein (DUF1697 family)